MSRRFRHPQVARRAIRVSSTALPVARKLPNQRCGAALGRRGGRSNSGSPGSASFVAYRDALRACTDDREGDRLSHMRAIEYRCCLFPHRGLVHSPKKGCVRRVAIHLKFSTSIRSLFVSSRWAYRRVRPSGETDSPLLSPPVSGRTGQLLSAEKLKKWIE